MSFLVSLVLANVWPSFRSEAEYVNSPERRKPAKATLHAVLKFNSSIDLSPVLVTSCSVEREIGSAFLMLSSGWQRDIPARIHFNHSELNGFMERCLSMCTERSADIIAKIVFALTFPWKWIWELPSARADAHSARVCS